MKLAYRTVRFLIGIGFRTFFQKIYILQKENVPKEDPILFAANHPTAFLEPMVHIPFLNKYSYFILRGDYFESDWARKALNSINVIPIFRQRDGLENMRKNKDLFGFFQDLLHKKKNITIMVEGSHDYHKRLRKVQRGTARMTIGTYKEYGDEDIAILPMGVSFSDVTAFRSIIMVKFGEPILLKDHIEQIQENERKTMLYITDQIQKRLRGCMVHIEKAEDDEVSNLLLDMNRNATPIPLLFAHSSDVTLLEQEIKLANAVNEMPAEQKAAFKTTMHLYQNALVEHKVTDLGIGKNYILTFWKTLVVFLGFPFFILSCLIHFPIILLVKKAMGMNKKKEFITSLGLAAASFGTAIYYLIGVLVALLLWNKWLFITLPLIPILGYFSLYYWDTARYWKAAWQFSKLDKKKKEQLLSLREEVFAFVRA